MTIQNIPNRDYESLDFDVCLSFAGEDRRYVERVANVLRRRGVRVFFDEYEQVRLWGKDLYVHLDDVYRNMARYCVLFVSKHYASKLWTNHERISAQARAFTENSEYILPARFDDTEIAGLRPTIHFIDLRKVAPGKFAEFVIKKIGPTFRKDYFPPIADKLYASLKLKNPEQKRKVYETAHEFFRALRRMTAEERRVLTEAVVHGCPGELPENIHINLDFLRRLTGLPSGKLKRIFANLDCLGFDCSIRVPAKSKRHLGDPELLVIEWHSLDVSLEDLQNDSEFRETNATEVASEMLLIALKDYCEDCKAQVIERLDFSGLAKALEEPHGRRRKRKTTKHTAHV